MRLWDFFVEKTYVDKMQKMLYENVQITYRRGACEIWCLVVAALGFIYASGWVLCFIFASEMKHFYVVEHLTHIAAVFDEKLKDS